MVAPDQAANAGRLRDLMAERRTAETVLRAAALSVGSSPLARYPASGRRPRVITVSRGAVYVGV